MNLLTQPITIIVGLIFSVILVAPYLAGKLITWLDTRYQPRELQKEKLPEPQEFFPNGAEIIMEITRGRLPEDFVASRRERTAQRELQKRLGGMVEIPPPKRVFQVHETLQVDPEKVEYRQPLKDRRFPTPGNN